MAMQVTPVEIGVDVGKDELVWAQYGEKGIHKLPNRRKAIRRWLRRLPEHRCLAVEATNDYHMELAEQAYKLGLQVYLVNGYRLNRYREGVGTRAKTDACDARLLARYLNREKDDLIRWTPPPKAYRRIQRLLYRRASLVRAKTTLRQSFEGLAEMRAASDALLRRMERLELLLQKRLRQAMRDAGWWPQVQRVQAIEGIGELNAIALVMAYHRGEFRSSDSFVAFLGLDVRVRDSGKLKGKRKLTNQGPREIRRLLYNAAMAARRSTSWADYYQRYRDRGMASTQALMILARKLVRVAFALLRNESEYRPRAAA